MKSWKAFALMMGVAFMAGCGANKRSISNSAYQAPPSGYAGPPSAAAIDSPFAYRGELSEFDVLGVTRGAPASDTEIQQALASAKRVRLREGNSILLLQSGAIFPDGPMVTELSKHFRVVPFTGVPPASRVGYNGPFERGDAGNFARSLRLAAARGGNDMIVCCWGVLESENAKLAGKTISWVPVVKWAVPDEREHMRIRLKLALVDVRTGDWSVLSPEPVDDSRISRSPRREVADRKLVESLKQRAYEIAAKELLRQYSDIAAAN
jgi:hypothetical protein